jgi:DmsE family decaheme c-type cytochrome
MHKNEPVSKAPSRVVPRKRSCLWARLVFVLTPAVICFAALAAPPPHGRPGAGQAAGLGSDFVGSDTCVTCHEEVGKKFAENPHTKMAEMHGANGVTCENCHGPGKAHVDGGGDISKIFNPAKHTNKEVDETCLSCHRSAHPNFERSPHAKADVGCISCHSVHESKAKEYLLKTSQPGLCYGCHADQKSQFSMPFHHRVNEGLIKCTDCHDTHGTFNQVNLRNTADQNAICTKCHTDVRGPFTFEHAPVRAEGCTTCHTPHGTQNPRLLNMPSVATLCNQCHSPVSAGGVHGLDAGSTTVTPCVTCHTMIHGSNASQAFVR